MVCALTRSCVNKGWPYCKSLIDECQTNTSTCATAQTACSALMFAPYTLSGMNPYNIELKVSSPPTHTHCCRLSHADENFEFEFEQCVKQPLCYDFTNIGDFMNNATVKEILGVSETVQWQDCNQTGECLLLAPSMKIFPNGEGGLIFSVKFTRQGHF